MLPDIENVIIVAATFGWSQPHVDSCFRGNDEEESIAIEVPLFSGINPQSDERRSAGVSRNSRHTLGGVRDMKVPSNVTRQRVGAAKGDNIGNSLLSPVREVANQVGHRFIGIKVADQTASGILPLAYAAESLIHVA